MSKKKGYKLWEDVPEVEDFSEAEKVESITSEEPWTESWGKSRGTTGGFLGSYGGVSYGTTYAACKSEHDGTKCIVVVGHDDEPKRYFSGARASAVDRDYASVVVDLCGAFTNPAPKTGSCGFFVPKDSSYDLSSLDQFEIEIPPPKVVPIARLKWADMGLPPVEIGVEWWRGFARAFPEEAKVVICCAGSHGRTGTALASILVAHGWSQKDAMKHVRAQHCKSAIETKSQEEYLLDLEVEYVNLFGKK